VITPPKAPCEGKYLKASKPDGQNFPMNYKSKDSFVSWRQMISHFDSAILSRIESHFLSEFKPLIFQLRIFHDLKEVVLAMEPHKIG
jgi:hypothetical protein